LSLIGVVLNQMLFLEGTKGRLGFVRGARG